MLDYPVESQTARWGCGICGARGFVLFMQFKDHLREHGWVVEVIDFHAKTNPDHTYGPVCEQCGGGLCELHDQR